MKKCGIAGLGLFLVLLTVGFANAIVVPLVNPSFESGLTGWSVTTNPGGGTATTPGSFTDPNNVTYSAQSGSQLLLLTASALGSVSVYQTVSVTQGATLNGWAAMCSAVGNSSDFSMIVSGYGSPVWFSSDSTGSWSTWPAWSAPVSGTYTFQFNLQNWGSTPSNALFDMPVPIPPTALLLASGLIGLIAIRRRKRV